MKQLVIMPGGFHPFHAGHYALYQSAQQEFPGADIKVAATNDTSQRPFPFKIKEKLAQLAGVKPSDFYQVKSPFRAEEITKNYTPEDTELIFVRSEKDATKPPQAGGNKKDGNPAYLQPLAGQDVLYPMNKHAYMAYLPTVEFGPGMTSATEIRTAWPELNDKRKTALVMSLYPKTQTNLKLAATVVKMLDTAIGEQLNEFLPALGAAIGGELAAATELGTMGTLGMRVAGHEVGSDIEDHLNNTDVEEGWKDLAVGSAMALGALGAGAQTMPNVNSQQVELTNKYYTALVQRAKEDGRELDTRTLNFLKAKAQDAAALKIQQKQSPQSKSQDSFPSQGSERRVAKDFDKFESRIINPENIDIFYRPDPRSRGKRVVAKNVPTTALDQLLAKLSDKFGVRDTDFEWTAADTRVSEDYVEEKWSQKYKSSINCAHPKGFSQRAHCAGRKK